MYKELKDIFIKLEEGAINRSDLVNLLPKPLLNEDLEIKKLADWIILSQDVAGVEFLLTLHYLIGKDSIFTGIFNQLTLEEFHFSHQPIVFCLQKIKSPSSIPFLEKMLESQFDYLEYTGSDSDVITKWISHALANIGTPDALSIIKKYKNAEDVGISKEMTYRLARIEAKRIKKIRFIINPFSGLSRKKNVPSIIEKNIDQSKFVYDIAFTERAGHAIELAKQAVAEHYDAVIAVGGDGSVNEVATSLIGTKVKLGILPGGSGNGFAMHLGLGRNIKKAVQILNSARTITIDTCQLNGRPFVNLGGTGFDALVAYRAKQSTLRGLWAYTKFAVLEAWQYPIGKYKLVIDNQVVESGCLVIEVANAQMFGYNFVIAPQAQFDDGLLDILLVKKAPKWRYLFSLWRFFNASFHKSSLVETFTGKDIKIIGKRPMPVHIDGEGYYLDEDLHFTINPLSLEVLVPA